MNGDRFIDQIDNVIIQAIPCLYCYEKDGLFGMHWKARAFLNLNDVDFLDTDIKVVDTDKDFAMPEDAIKCLKKQIESVKKRLNTGHLITYSDYIKPIKDFEKELKRKNGCPEVISLEAFLDGDFYTDDGDYCAYVVYGDNVFTYFNFDRYDFKDDEPYDGIRDCMLTKLEIVMNAFGCKLEDITNVLFVDYPECK
jgi:hypothetical protein